jgi:hypothetical protein
MPNDCAQLHSAITVPESYLLDRSASDWSSTTPDIRPQSRFRAIVASVSLVLTRICVDRPATFEIRNIQTGERAPAGPFSDGTQADRIARELGPAWRVFRGESPHV